MAPLAVLGLAGLSLAAYALVGDKAKDGADSGRGGFVLGSFVRRWFYWVIRPFEAFFARLLPSPTAFNVLGAALGALSGCLFAFGMTAPAGWCVLACGLADVLDGRIARAHGVASERGAFLDSTLDRFAEVGAFAGLAVLFLDVPWLTATASLGLGGSLLVSYSRARGESLGVVCKKGVMQRAERILLLGLGAVFDPMATSITTWQSNSLLAAAVVLIAAGTMGTAAYRTVWIANRLPARNASGLRTLRRQDSNL